MHLVFVRRRRSSQTFKPSKAADETKAIAVNCIPLTLKNLHNIVTKACVFSGLPVAKINSLRKSIPLR